MKKKLIPLIGSGVVAILIAVCCMLCLERVSVGNVGVVYSMSGVKDTTLSAGWHWLSPFESVKQCGECWRGVFHVRRERYYPLRRLALAFTL